MQNTMRDTVIIKTYSYNAYNGTTEELIYEDLDKAIDSTRREEIELEHDLVEEMRQFIKQSIT